MNVDLAGIGYKSRAGPQKGERGSRKQSTRVGTTGKNCLREGYK